ncbi:hypothetical protein [Rhodococcoides trifolii]|nr:hypothetical protein [Rhodococcus trifolii]
MSCDFVNVREVVASMDADELDNAIFALTARQRAFLLSGDLEDVWSVTKDLEVCLAERSRLGESQV